MTSIRIPASLVQLVRERASEYCEYCLLPQWSQEANFHVDHIQPRSAAGPTTAENLALACVSCSLRKAARERIRDPHSNVLVPIYHPRYDNWSDHFEWTASWRIKGKTPTGRAT